MFCIQCEQTLSNSKVNGCAFAAGMCGKSAEVSNAQDQLIYGLQLLCTWANKAREYGIVEPQIDEWIPQALFATLTNVNFDIFRINALSQRTEQYIGELQDLILLTDVNAEPVSFATLHQEEFSEDVIGLHLLCLYGLKGVAAYMEHARVLGCKDVEVYTEFNQIMAWLATNPSDLNALLECSMQIGMLNFKVMQMLDAASTSRFGAPTPTEVNTKPQAGKCILVSGHDLIDLEHILQQTQGTGIKVYTNGEMLPAHGYPELKKYPHLVGNYGSAWQNQQQEFANFPGAIVMTSNCIIEPKGYSDRIFTRNIVGWPNVAHIEGDDFSAVIECALAQDGFKYDEIEHKILVGFGREALLGAAPAVIEQVKAGNIKHFFLVGGCDGEKKARSYYTDFALSIPQDSLLLTLACGKFRFNQHSFGDINGIPRLLDVGQCNDAYAAIVLALELSKAFDVEINQLPLTLVLSWFEQKAIVVLLTLFALGVKGIYIGPSLPAFLTENLISIIQNKFDLRVICEPDSDIKTMLSA